MNIPRTLIIGLDRATFDIIKPIWCSIGTGYQECTGFMILEALRPSI